MAITMPGWPFKSLSAIKITSKISLNMGTLLNTLASHFSYTSTIFCFRLKTNTTTTSHSCRETCKAFIVAPSCSRSTLQSSLLLNLHMPLCVVIMSQPLQYIRDHQHLNTNSQAATVFLLRYYQLSIQPLPLKNCLLIA